MLFVLHEEQAEGTFHAIKALSRIQIANMGINPELAPSLMRSAHMSMRHIRLKDLSYYHNAELVKLAPFSCYNFYEYQSKWET